MSKRKPVVVDWILPANTNRQILKGKVFLKEQKRVTCLCTMQGVSSLSSDVAFLKTLEGLSVKQLPFKFAVIFFCRLDSSSKHKPSDIESKKGYSEGSKLTAVIGVILCKCERCISFY